MTMREKRGFWFDSKSLEVIPVSDHLKFLEDLEGKFIFEFSKTPDEERWGKALGMKPVVGWKGLFPGERVHVRRSYLLEAMKRGWVRIRGHSDKPRMTIEFWKKSDGLMAALGWAVKQVAGSGETLELHEVSTDTPWLVSAKELIAQASGKIAEGGELTAPGTDMMRELWSRTVEANKGRKGKGGGKMRIYANLRAEGMHVRGNPATHDDYDNPAGPFSNPRCGAFTADSPALCFGRRFGKMAPRVSNPEEFDEYISPEKGEGPSVAQLFVGLTRGLGKHRGRAIDPSWVIEFVKARRKAQLPKKLPGGASFIMQRGFFTDWEAQHLHPNEKSLQVLVYPEFGGGESLRTFDKNMRELAMKIRREFDQKAVILNLVVNGRQSFLGEAKWKGE